MTRDRKFKRPRMWSHPRILVRRMLMAWPVLVWLAAIFVVLNLQSEVSQYGDLTGVVYTDEQAVSPPETARLSELLVRVGDRVKAGDVVARMDTSLLDAEIAAEEALALEDTETFSRYQESILGMARRFESAIIDARANLESDKLAQVQAEAELAELERELARREALLKDRLIRQEEVAILRPQIAALQKAVEAYPGLIDVRKDAVEMAKQERGSMRRWLRLKEGETVSEAIERKRAVRSEVLSGTLEVRKMARDRYVLRASHDGEVSRIYHLAGEVVMAGDPVLRVVTASEPYVVGFLRQIQQTTVTVGQEVSVWRQGEGRQERIRGVVESISPDVQWLPELVSPIPGQLLRGRRVSVRLTEKNALIPGESVHITSSRPAWVRLLRRGIWRRNGTTEQAE